MMPATWYHAEAQSASTYPALADQTETDVCVVGGGIAGCSTALHLAGRGYRVALLEADRIGSGASGRSGAQAITGVACGQDKLERLVGLDTAKRIWDMTVEGLALQRELIARHLIDCDYTAGQMQVAIKPRQELALRKEVSRLQQVYGYHSMRMMDRAELCDCIASSRYIAATYDPNAGHLQPLRYTRGLAEAAAAQGVQIFENTRALAHQRRDGRLVIRTAKGEIVARHLALCGNAALGQYSSALARKIMGVATYIIATESLGEARASELIRNGAAVTDTNFVLDYFRRSADHRLLFGGRVSYSGLDPLGTRRATRARMLQVFPQLADARIDHAWGGYVDITMNRAPHFGRLEPDVYFVQGFSGHGIALTGLAGKLLAEAISGTSERFDVFSRIPHHEFPGGDALRRPLLVLAMLWYRLRDWL
jgi:gamma-glutamylputrescine oxidase